ncbi:MAG TPA: iron-sulfur cluster assembly accessory protein [Acidobacteriota bacterium]|nr:iron-sulfur cluster assembly accessory protein [Acidobacteriota bacterium]HMZ80897.1 iron-sulfur cluster assembly accessory protein [Acidobacteriota bacterium]HNB74368.1 iron-sulfur cluster assembly accessory protein [Acidobacteriota bacterium]HNC45880.1 iron-sulfur cluster assembly accessory protein [Acidobacteriota bacterium]HND21081.1 iron-sulfur cluster assembly accessory protein [Acidobacteriota bacterium]
MQLTLTPKAISEVKKFIADEGLGKEGGLRVRVMPGGCSGFQYALDVEEAPRDGDNIMDSNGLRVFIDPFSEQYLEGVEIDYVTSVMGSGFTFRNPNAAGSCGCGSSFTV